MNGNQAPKEKRASPRTDVETIEIEHVTEEEAEALKMRSVTNCLRSRDNQYAVFIFSYLSTSSIFDQRVPEPCSSNHSNELELKHTRQEVSESNKNPWVAIDESLARNRFSPGKYSIMVVD